MSTHSTQRTSGSSTRWWSWFAIGAWMVLARAALRGAADGYAAAGLGGVALSSASRDVLEGLTLALPAALLLVLLGRRGGARAVPAVAVVLGGLFIAGHLPPSRAHAPPLDTPTGLAVHGGVLVGTLLLLYCLSPGRRGAVGLAAAGLVAATLACLPALLPAGVLAAVEGGVVATWPGRPHVVLISLDTVRADHLGCYGYARDTTPRLDALASQAARFTRAVAPEPWTLSSHMSLMTGLTPIEHGVVEDRPLAPGVTTLARRFADAGYVTAAVVDTVPWMDARFGFDRGFHLYRSVHGAAGAKRAVAEAWMDDVGDRPLFLFVHLFDAHSDWREWPYESEPADRARLASGASLPCDEPDGCGSRWLQAVNAEGRELGPGQRADLVALYDAGLASLDREVGRLLDAVDARGRGPATVLVVTADHGEEFMEHGRVLHEQLYEECMAVPLLVATPATRGGAGGGRVDQLVGLIDVGATLLELIGLQPSPGPGRSFAGLLPGGAGLAGAGPVRDGLLLVQDEAAVGWRTERWKLIRRRDGGVELYDLQTDPGELRDLAGERPALLASLEAALDRRLEQARRRALTLGTHRRADADAAEALLDAAERERLRALGYLGEDGGER